MGLVTKYIDEYVIAHYETASVQQMATSLGISTAHIHHKMAAHKLKDHSHKFVVSRVDIQLEIDALMNYIDVRKEGIWVDIAQDRVKQLYQTIEQLTL